MTDISKGETLFAEGNVEEAEKCFLDLLKKEPTNAEALNDLGVIQHAKGNAKGAEDLFLKAIAAKEDYLEALLNLVALYQNAERWSEAIAQLEKCIQIENKDPKLFNMLGTFSLEMGNTEKARMALIKSLELNPDQETVRESMERLEKRGLAPSYLPTPDSFRGAFAEINITPNVSEQNPVFLQGMGGSPRKATAVSAPLMMQFLLLEDDHFTKVLFIAADLFGFGPEIVDNVRTLVAQWGIEPEGLILNASHTHYAPGTISHASKSIGPFYSEYAKQIVQAIAQQLPILYGKLEECELSWGKSEAQIGVNRRLKKEGKVHFGFNENGFYDKDTPFLFVHFKRTDSKLVLVNHGCHPTGLGEENKISSDFPGYMRDVLAASGLVDAAMFLQGAAGSAKEASAINEDIQFCDSSAGAKENGERLALQIIEALDGKLQPVKGSLFCARKQAMLPLKPLPLLAAIGRIKDQPNTSPLIKEWAAHLLKKFPEGKYPDSLSMETQLVSLGEGISFITLPGEPVAELAEELRILTNNPDSTFILGYTNGLIGYLPTDVLIEEGGYETDASQFVYLLASALDTGTESAIISGTKDCLNAKADNERPTGYGRYHLAKKKQNAFFVLSAGRCGTLTLAHLLNTATNANVWHHPQPDPIQESLLAYWGAVDKKKAFWKARYSIIHKTWAQGLIHGETDLLMTPFCDMIANEIPDSKFIVLVRNPRDFVRSGMRRNYYYGHPWDFGRLRPKESTDQFEEWNRLDQFEKICWLWRETYEYTLKIMSKIPKERVFVLGFEDLVRDESKTKELFAFLGLHGFDSVKIRKVLDEKFNAQRTGNFAQPEDWPSDLSTKLWNECEKIAGNFGYRDDGSKNRVSDDSCSEIRRVEDVGGDEKKKLLFLELPGTSTGGHLEHVVEHLNQDYHVKYIKTGDHDEITNLVNWADLVWLEWANQMAIHVTNKIPQIKDKKVICRLHGYEVFTDMPAHINWSAVDHLVFVAKHKQEIFNQRFKTKSPTQAVIRNGINTEKFAISDNKQNTKRLVIIGHLNFRKGIPLLLQFYHELLKVDPDYFLYIRGEFQDLKLEMAARTMIRELSLDKKLEFVDWVEDLNSWLADKSHILSFSLEESFHYTIGNGMAAGLKPIIHAWEESRDIWPNQFIFKDLHEFLQLVMDNTYNPKEYRNWIETHVSASLQVDEIRNILTSLERKPTITYNDIKNYYNERYNAKQEHTMRPANSYEVFLDRLNVQKGKRLLDVACGTGYLVRASKDRGLDTVGIDISYEASKVSRRVVGDACILNCLGEYLPFKSQAFDYISCIGSLEHFLDLNKGLQEFKRVLKDDGSACIVVPNENFIGWQNKTQKGTAQKDINENLDTLDGWEELLKHNGFEIQNIFQDNAVCPNVRVATDLCYQFIFMCRKKRPDIKIHYRPIKVLITGGYGFGNLGDEAILNSYIKMFQADSQFTFRIRVITGNPMETSFLHPDIEKTIQWDRGIFQKELSKTDILLFGGGGIFFDFNNPKLRNLENRCFIANKAYELGKKVAFLGIGVDNLYIQQNRRLLKETLNKSALITVRDSNSFECLKKIGMTREIYLTADPVFSFYNGGVNEYNKKDSRTIGLCLRPTNMLLHEQPKDDTILAKKIAGFLNHLLDKTSYSLEFISCKPGYDDLYAREVMSYINDADRCKILTTKHWDKVIEHQKKYRAFIGMSLHSLIFAFMNHLPIIGISYCTKVDSLFNRLNISQFSIQMDGDVTSRLISCWETLEQGYANFKFWEMNNELKLRAFQNIELLKALY